MTEYGSSASSMPQTGAPVGEMDLTRVIRAWHTVRNELVPTMDAVDERYARDTSTLTARRFDEAQPGGRRTYIRAMSLIRVALDNLDGLEHLIRHRGATIWAPWTLLRSVFESSAWANWLLDPDTGVDRRRRGIRRAVLDQKEWKNFATEFVQRSPDDYAKMMARDTANMRTYRDEAAAAGLAWDRAAQKLNLIEELPRLSIVREMLTGVDVDPRLITGMWRSLSGMTHGYPYAAQNNSEIIASIDIPGGRRVTYSIDDASFDVHAMTSTGLLVGAIALFIRRSNEPA